MDRESIERFYTEESPEEIRLQEGGAQHLEFKIASEALARFLPPGSRILDSCAGTGAYAFWLAGQGHAVTAGDIVPRNVQWMQQRQPEEPFLDEILLLDAQDLGQFEDGQFTAVLCMGALYHLPGEAQRDNVMREGLRVLAPGGLFAATYMNRYAVIQNNCRGSLDDLPDILRFLQDGKEGVFYTSTPEETETLMARHHLQKLCHLSMDGISNFLYTTSGLLDETGLLRFEKYHRLTCEVPSLLGAGYHNLFIGRKE